MIEKLEELIENMDSLAGSWDGREPTFTHEGNLHQEDEAHMAMEISDRAKELKKLIRELEEM